MKIKFNFDDNLCLEKKIFLNDKMNAILKNVCMNIGNALRLW